MMEITRGRVQKPIKAVIYGPEGIGKSTFASKFPDPVFIDTEGSTTHMDVARFPAPTSWQLLLQEIEEVKRNPSCCKTLVVDTADWAEKLCIEDICSAKHVDGIEDFGYGKGYTFVKESFGKFLNLLNDVLEKGINVVITAHAQMRKFEQPDELGAYDRWELKLSKQCAPLLKEWADLLLFCNYKTVVVNVDNRGATKGKNKAQGGKRVIYTQHHSCWDAKNRFGLPEEIDMDYEQIKKIVESKTPENSTAAAQTPTVITPVHTESKVTLTENAQIDMVDYAKLQRGAEIVSVPENKQPDPDTVSNRDIPEEVPTKSDAFEDGKKETPVVSPYLSDPERIPKNLRDLMEQNNISEWNIQDAAFAKGYYPENTLIQDMDPAFVQGWIVAFFPKVCELIENIKKTQEIPFS